MSLRARRGLLLLGTLVLIDLALRGLASVGWVPYEHHFVDLGEPSFLDDLDPVVGVWHHPNARRRHRHADFDVVYESNSHGARDRERTRESDAARRVIVLGDSFVEGFGVARGQRFTDLLEERTGVEHLNFGTSGSFGSIQEWLLYDSLASGFDHSEVCVFTLPHNDFRDNDPDEFSPSRYRPYLRRSDAGLEVYYTVPFEERERVERDWLAALKNSIDNNWYLANLLRWTARELGRRLRPEPRAPRAPRSSYDAFSPLDLERLLFTYERIAERAAGRPVTLFTIPVEGDFERARREGYDFELVEQLTAFAERRPGIRYVDLLPPLLEHAAQHGLRYADYVHASDFHWNARGHAAVAGFVERALQLQRR